MPKRIDLTGQQFGCWTVKHYVGKQRYQCQCSCGKIKIVKAQHLRNGTSTNCGHIRRTDLVGRVFGEWIVKSYLSDCYYLCECSCGTLKAVAARTLVSGKSKSCGCRGTRRKKAEV